MIKSEDAVSEVIGMVLILSIVMAVIGAIMLVGIPVIESGKNRAKMDVITNNFLTLQNDIEEVVRGPIWVKDPNSMTNINGLGPSRETEFELMEGNLATSPSIMVYYVTLIRQGINFDNFTMRIFSDSGRTNLLFESKLNQSRTTKWRYIYAVTNLGDSANTASGWIDDINVTNISNGAKIVYDNFSVGSTDPGWIINDSLGKFNIDRSITNRINVNGLPSNAINESIKYDNKSDIGNFTYNFTIARSESTINTGLTVGIADTNNTPSNRWNNGTEFDLQTNGSINLFEFCTYNQTKRQCNNISRDIGVIANNNSNNFSIMIPSNNIIYNSDNDEIIYENGAVIRKYEAGEALMLSEPLINIYNTIDNNTTGDSNITISIHAITLLGTLSSTGGEGKSWVDTIPQSYNQTIPPTTSPNANKVILYIYSVYSDAWRNYFDSKLKDAGLTVSNIENTTGYNISGMSPLQIQIYGNNVNPSAQDIFLSLYETRLNVRIR